MNIDLVTIIISAEVIVISLLATMLNPFFRRKFLKQTTASPDGANDGQGQSLPPVTILITVNDNAKEVEDRLPLYLEQDYPADFQVVIVSNEDDSETEDILKRHASNPHVYHTFIPSSSRYVSRKKLAITMGVKAARHEWILLTDIYCRPSGKDWLRAMAENSREDKNMVLGISEYDAETKTSRRFEHAHTLFYVLRRAALSTAFRTNCPNLMFRKSEFIAQNGFSGNLDLVRGEYELLVNKFARKGSAAIAVSKESRVIEDNPPKRRWHNKHIYYLACRHRLAKGLSWRLLCNLDQWAIHLPLLLILGSAAYSIITQRWIITCAAALALLLTIIIRTVIGKKAFKALQMQMPSWRIYAMEIGLARHGLANILRYRTADKMDFTSHKL